MTYSLTLEHGSDGSYLAWVHELPGCFARAATREGVVANAAQAVAEFRQWLRNVGEPIEDDDIDVVVVAEVGSRVETDEDTEVLVEPDRQPLTKDDWRKIEHWLTASRTELLEVLAPMADEQLGEHVPGGDRTFREQLIHLAFVELMYAAWTFDHQSKEGIADFLTWTRGVAITRIRTLADRLDDDVTQAEWADAPYPELWTARKAARRLIWHERLHLPQFRG